MFHVYIYQHTVKTVIQTDTNETVRPYSLNVGVHFTVKTLKQPPMSQKMDLFIEVAFE